jgi:DNA-binding protein HU-beta
MDRNKAQTIDAMVEKSEGKLTKRQAEIALNAFLDTVTESLAAKGSLQLVGWGTFDTIETKARTGTNPQDRTKKVDIPAGTKARFRAGAKLKAAVNQ